MHVEYGMFDLFKEFGATILPGFAVQMLVLWDLVCALDVHPFELSAM